MAADAQKFCLKWNDFRQNVTAAFEDLLQYQELVDITLCCEGKKIKAHKMMLSACSPYFRDLLKDNPCQHPLVFLRDVTYKDLSAVIDFVYRGEVNVQQRHLASFLKTAEMLQVKGLTDDDAKVPPQSSPPPSDDVASTALQPPSSQPQPHPAASSLPAFSSGKRAMAELEPGFAMANMLGSGELDVSVLPPGGPQVKRARRTDGGESPTRPGNCSPGVQRLECSESQTALPGGATVSVQGGDGVEVGSVSAADPAEVEEVKTEHVELAEDSESFDASLAGSAVGAGDYDVVFPEHIDTDLSGLAGGPESVGGRPSADGSSTGRSARFPRSSVLQRCPHCPAVFSSKTTIKDHVARAHFPVPVQCTVGGKLCANQVVLRVHRSRVHRTRGRQPNDQTTVVVVVSHITCSPAATLKAATTVVITA